MKNTGRGVIDFSKWNTMPDWQQRGFKSREEFWETFWSAQYKFAPEAFKNRQHVQEQVNIINSKKDRNMTPPRHTWIVVTPDGREIFRETGGADAEGRARARAEQFNRHAPRDTPMAQVRLIHY